MPHCIIRIFEPLPRLLLSTPGRHRRPEQQSAGLYVEASTSCTFRASASPVLRREEIGLIDPHLAAHEHREQQPRQAGRHVVRRAVHGIFIDAARPADAVEVRAW